MEQIKDLSNARYVLLPGKMPFNCQYIETYNRVFKFWEERWTTAFNNDGGADGYWLDHYQRQDVIAALITSDEVVACHLYALYNLRSEATLKSEYFHYLPEIGVQKLKSLKMNNFMTMEYLCANPAWRKNTMNASVSVLVIALGAILANSIGVEAIIGTPAIGNTVDKNSGLTGFETICKPVRKHNYDVDFCYSRVDQQVTIKDQRIKDYALNFWSQKQSYIPIPGQNVPIKIAS